MRNTITEETLATGFVKPKTTSLFFDKIWIPRKFKHSSLGEMLNYNTIPDELCFIESLDELWTLIDKENKQANKSQGKTGSSENVKKLVKGFLRSINNYPRYVSSNMRTRSYSVDDRVEQIIDKIEFVSSINRNKGIREISDSFRLIFNVYLTPVYFKKTQFEQNFKAINILDVSADAAKVNALTICINYIPEIVEEKLNWEQVINIRKDKSTIEALRRFCNWSFLNLENKSEHHILELLNKEIDEYKAALKKHGVLTVVGGFTTVLSASSTVIDTLANSSNSFLSSGISISAALITFTAAQIVDYWAKKRNPIAFIYDISNIK